MIQTETYSRINEVIEKLTRRTEKVLGWTAFASMQDLSFRYPAGTGRKNANLSALPPPGLRMVGLIVDKDFFICPKHGVNICVFAPQMALLGFFS